MYEIFEQLLREKDLTHYKVWRETGVAQSTLSDWKNGKGRPGPANLAKLADYFGVTVDYLMGREQNERPAANSDEPEVKPVYLSLAKDMQKRGIHPDDIKDMMDLLEKRRNRNDQS